MSIPFERVELWSLAGIDTHSKINMPGTVRSRGSQLKLT
jgi:hypothetical protein